ARDLPVRRFLLGARLGHRGAAAESVEARDARRDRADRRATCIDDQRRRPDRRDRARRRRRPWNTRDFAGDVRDVRRDCRVAADAAGGLVNAKTMKATERIQMQGGPGRGFGPSTINQKPISFRASGKRVLRRLRPQRVKIIVVLLAGVASVALAALGPKVLGGATDLIFAGVIGKTLPANITKQQAVDSARAQGQTRIADLISGI